MEKGVSPFISASLVILFVSTAIGIVILFLHPSIKKSQESIALIQTERNLELIEKNVEEVASEGLGSLRRIKVWNGGEMGINPLTGKLEAEVKFSYLTLDSGIFLKKGNIFKIVGGWVKTDENGTHLFLENEIIKAIFPKMGDENSFQQINTSEMISSIYLKPANEIFHFFDTSVFINNKTNSSWGDGYSKLIKKGDFLGKGEAFFHIESEEGYIYDIVFTLFPKTDFLLVEIMNTTGKEITMNWEYKLGNNHTDDKIRIGNEENQTKCYLPNEIPYYYACSFDDIEFGKAKLFGIVYRGKVSDMRRICFQNLTSSYKFNFTSQDEFKLIISFTEGDCELISSRMYQVLNYTLFSTMLSDYSTKFTEENIVHFFLEFDNIRLEGDKRFGKGNIFLCIEKERIKNEKIIISIKRC